MKKLILGLVVATAWAVWTEYRVTGLEVRLNVHEATEHWQETPEVAK